MILKQIPSGYDANFAYLIADKKTKEGAIIDPSVDISKIKEEIKDELRSELEEEIKFFIDSKYVMNLNALNSEPKNIHKEKVNPNVEPERYFKLADGTILKNIIELNDKIKSIDMIVFDHHNNHEKNDFAEWIKKVFHNQELYQKLLYVKDKNQFSRILDEYIRTAVQV